MKEDLTRAIYQAFDMSHEAVALRAQANGLLMSQQRAEDAKQARLAHENRVAELACLIVIQREDDVDMAFQLADVFENERERRRVCAEEGIDMYAAEETDE